ncbi:hypothetical protein F5887DRAFT_1076601 [Amanita rubescens]|nr:hypothetical protein F5887DRAFT_1076601 [Amanita rubescens]
MRKANGSFASNGNRTFSGFFHLPTGTKGCRGTFEGHVPAFAVPNATITFQEESDLSGKYDILHESAVEKSGHMNIVCDTPTNYRFFAIEGILSYNLYKLYNLTGSLVWA